MAPEEKQATSDQLTALVIRAMEHVGTDPAAIVDRVVADLGDDEAVETAAAIVRACYKPADTRRLIANALRQLVTSEAVARTQRFVATQKLNRDLDEAVRTGKFKLVRK